MKFALFASMALGGYVIHVAKAHKNNDTVKELDLGLYLGEWYQQILHYSIIGMKLLHLH